MNAHGTLNFQNIPVAAPIVPAPLTFADEGLSVFGGNTVQLGEAVAPGAPFTTTRYIDLADEQLIFEDSVAAGQLIIEAASVLAVDQISTIDLDAKNALLAFETLPTGSGLTFGPRIDLAANHGADNGLLSLIQFDTEGAFPFLDGDSAIESLSRTLKFFNDQEGFQFHLSDALTNSLPAFELLANDPVYFGRISTAIDNKYALVVENTNAGGFAALKVISQFDGIISQALTATGFADVRLHNHLDAVIGQYYLDVAGNTVNLRYNGTSSLQIRQAAGTSNAAMLQNGQLNLLFRQYIGSISTAPTARLHIVAQAAAASSAPLKFTASATLMTTPENGAFEFDGTNLYFTVGGVRRTVTLV